MKIEKVGVKVGRKLDIGFAPYMQYLDEIKPKSPAFGTRENSNVEIEFYVGALMEDGDDLLAVLVDLKDQANQLIDNHLGTHPVLPMGEVEAFEIQPTEIFLNDQKVQDAY